MTPENQGQRAAWQLFGVITGLDLLSFAVGAVLGPAGIVFVVWLLSIPAVGAGGLIAAAIVAHRLPKEARKSFWATGFICMGLTVLLFSLSCGLSVLGSIAGR